MSWFRKDDEDLCREREKIRWSKQKKLCGKDTKARGDEAAEENNVVLWLGGLKHVGCWQERRLEKKIGPQWKVRGMSC